MLHQWVHGSSWELKSELVLVPGLMQDNPPQVFCWTVGALDDESRGIETVQSAFYLPLNISSLSFIVEVPRALGDHS